jgi:hypothetical protein
VVSTGEMVRVAPAVGVELHPAIVIAVSNNQLKALVIYGTGTLWRELPYVLIDPNRPDGVAARSILFKPTFFYANAVRSCAVDSLKPHTPLTKCPRSKWPLVRALAFDGCRERQADVEYKQWLPE